MAVAEWEKSLRRGQSLRQPVIGSLGSLSRFNSLISQYLSSDLTNWVGERTLWTDSGWESFLDYAAILLAL